jgi:MerR family transcriptional regulator, light-induced transcriptional regulator
MPNTVTPDAMPSPTATRLRSGTAARLAGLPVTTLRVWERRYGVVAALKTTTGQRLYCSHDVQRLRLIKELTDLGYAIGTIATLQLEPLRALIAGLRVPASGEAVAPRRVVVIGHAAARKLEAVLRVPAYAVFEDLGNAEAAGLVLGAAEVLLVNLPSLQPAAAERVLALRAALNADSIVLTYAFGAEATADSLRAAGALVRREPTTGHELARLVARSEGVPLAASANRAWQAAPRRFTDEALIDLTEAHSSVACECARHLAEVVMQLTGFERYSADCRSSSLSDAALHTELHSLAGAARTLFEQALERLAIREGLAVRLRD